MEEQLAVCLSTVSQYLEVTQRQDWDHSIGNTIGLMHNSPLIENELAFRYEPEEGKIADLNSNWTTAGWFFQRTLINMDNNARWLIEKLAANQPRYWKDTKERVVRDNNDTGEGEAWIVRVDPSYILANTIDLVIKNANRAERIDPDKVRSKLKHIESQVAGLLGEEFSRERWSYDSIQSRPKSERMRPSAERKKVAKQAEATEVRNLAVSFLRAGARKQRDLELRNKIGPLYRSKELAGDYLEVLRAGSLDDYRDFEDKLKEQFKKRRTSSRSRIKRVGVSDKLVWKGKEENPDLNPEDLMRKIMLEWLNEEEIQDWLPELGS